MEELPNRYRTRIKPEMDTRHYQSEMIKPEQKRADTQWGKTFPM